MKKDFLMEVLRCLKKKIKKGKKHASLVPLKGKTSRRLQPQIFLQRAIHLHQALHLPPHLHVILRLPAQPPVPSVTT
jgi:hypothetical protein